ncbi:MAG: GNAT family N-acetyltransferase [Rivularia sp. ALOHA_DT_140]|nr:GNAT family N-acetyltransferase [Rivularia sp. ALOHA_DT_140]
MLTLKVLDPGDEELLEAFVLQHINTSMFLRSNLQAAGLVDGNQRYQGTYVAIVENQEIKALAAHYWNGMVVVQAPVYLEEVVRAVVEKSNRAISGITGEAEQVKLTRKALQLEHRPTQLNDDEILFSLALDKLQIPAALTSGKFKCRHPLSEELDLLTKWRVDYCVETLGDTETPELVANCRQGIESSQAQARHWVLVAESKLVSYSAFNARLPDMVQIGGVYTPQFLRGQGYAKCVLAGSLLEAKSQGVYQALLFTSKNNLAAQAVYRGIGFQETGEKYGLLLFRPLAKIFCGMMMGYSDFIFWLLK